MCHGVFWITFLQLWDVAFSQLWLINQINEGKSFTKQFPECKSRLEKFNLIFWTRDHFWKGGGDGWGGEVT